MLKNWAIKGFIGLSCLAAIGGAAGCGQDTIHSTYQFQVEDVSQVNVNQQTNIDVTLKATEIRSEGYDKVLIRVDVTNKDNLELKATDTQSQEWDVAQVGYWGPPDGFAITKDYDVTTEFRVTAKAEGAYTVTLNLVDLDNNDAVLATKTITFTAAQ